jgi:hypothetical protein
MPPGSSRKLAVDFRTCMREIREAVLFFKCDVALLRLEFLVLLLSRNFESGHNSERVGGSWHGNGLIVGNLVSLLSRRDRGSFLRRHTCHAVLSASIMSITYVCFGEHALSITMCHHCVVAREVVIKPLSVCPPFFARSYRLTGCLFCHRRLLSLMQQVCPGPH